MHASEVTGDYGPLMSGEGVGRWSQPQVELGAGAPLFRPPVPGPALLLSAAPPGDTQQISG